MKSYPSAPERSDRNEGRHSSCCVIDRYPEALSTGDSSGIDGELEAAGKMSAPEMGNRRSSVHDSGSVRRGKEEVECYQCGPREMALGLCECLRAALRR